MNIILRYHLEPLSRIYDEYTPAKRFKIRYNICNTISEYIFY